MGRVTFKQGKTAQGIVVAVLVLSVLGGAFNPMLDKNADSLTKLTDMRSDYSSSEDKVYYYQIIDGKNHYMTYDTFSEFFTEYDNPSNRMALTVFPIIGRVLKLD
jgi:hypothetical protein